MRDLAVSLALAMPSTEPSLTTQHCSSPSLPCPLVCGVSANAVVRDRCVGPPTGLFRRPGRAPLNNFTTRPSGLASRVSQRCD